MRRRRSFIILLICSFTGGFLAAQDSAEFSEDSISKMLSQWHAIPGAEVTSVGLGAGARGLDEVPGALHVIRPAELERYAYTDPLRVLRSVSGVNIQEEDGFGLRPNIGLRGSGSDRSARITLMEDGVLIAPAPYSAPAAYYFPSIARMESVEVLKGSSQIAFGPQTAGGAINLVTPQAAGPSGILFRSERSSFGGYLRHLRLRQEWQTNRGTWSSLVEAIQLGSDGFKSLPNADPTGFTKTDGMVKIRWEASKDARFNQSIEVKGGWVQELSHETYAGLAEADFVQNPFQRYAASSNDLMESKHRQMTLRHEAELTARWSVRTDVYRMRFHRNWYKLDRYRDASGNSQSLLSLYESGQTAVLQEPTALDALLQLKANNRDYLAQGIQHRGVIKGQSGNQLVYGLRVHEDEVDRFEWRDGYQLTDGRMRMVQPGEQGSAGNRLDGARALAGYVRGTIRLSNWTLTPGIRTEQMEFFRLDYGADNGSREEEPASRRTNQVSVWLPGLGVNYSLSEEAQLFAGVHRGFIPPGSAPGTQSETSVNTELGYRWSSRRFNGQVVAFYNSYNHLMGSDLTANGGVGTGDLFNGGSARTHGVECEVALDLLASSDTWSAPLRLTYTYTDARFTSDFESDFGPWDAVKDGDFLPYLAPHQGNAQISLVTGRWSGELSYRYVAAMRTMAGRASIDLVEATDVASIFDAVIRREFGSNFSAYAGVNNVFDAVVVVARRPAGLRPAMPRLFRVGMRWSM